MTSQELAVAPDPWQTGPFFGAVHYDFGVLRPTTLAEALAIAAEPETVVVGWGSTWIKELRRRLVEPAAIVALDRVAELQAVRTEGEVLVIGAMATMSDLARHPDVRRGAPLLLRTLATIAGPAIRNIASLGGNVALRYDVCAPLIALGATVVTRSASATRTLTVADAVADPAFPAPGELLVELRLPLAPAGWGYERFMPRAGHAFATMAVAAALRRHPDGAVASLGVGLGVSQLITPFALRGTAALEGRPLDAGAVEALAEEAAERLDCEDDGKATPEYRRQLARVGVRRALAQATVPEEE